MISIASAQVSIRDPSITLTRRWATPQDSEALILAPAMGRPQRSRFVSMVVQE